MEIELRKYRDVGQHREEEHELKGEGEVVLVRHRVRPPTRLPGTGGGQVDAKQFSSYSQGVKADEQGIPQENQRRRFNPEKVGHVKPLYRERIDIR